jgi:hypothetical protein
MTVMSIIFSLRQKSASQLWFGEGTFGCTDTQVQAKIVARQPQIMSNNFRQLLISSQDWESGADQLFRVCRTGTALPFLESRWMRIRRRSIAVCDVDWCGCRQESIRGCTSHRQHVCATPNLNLSFYPPLWPRIRKYRVSKSC